MGLLYDKLTEYRDSDFYGFHMPGHKRNEKVTGAGLPYGIDITEIDGFDDLHHAKGILYEAQKRAADLYGSDETCFLINGSTSGILSAVMGCTEKGDKILVARNCHKSVYHAIYLNELKPVYLYPDFCDEFELNGAIRKEDVEKALEDHQDIRAVVIVSPTYDGVVSDVENIAGIVHKYGIPLIVDEAHGAHFGFHPYFPQNSVSKGADIVIHSLHKTLPALTQTALLHMNGNIIDREEVRSYLHMIQTSSPSYVLMAGIDECVSLIEEKGGQIFSEYVKLLEYIRGKLQRLKYLHLAETECYDRSKLVISVKNTGWTGIMLKKRLLENYHLQMEMAAGSYVLAMTSVADTEEGMGRLERALYGIDKEIEREKALSGCIRTDGKTDGQRKITSLIKAECVYNSYEIAKIMKKARKNNGEACFLPWDVCNGYISAEYAYLYPPGIPLIVPGERISYKVIEMLKMYDKMGFDIEGLKRHGKIEVWTGE